MASFVRVNPQYASLVRQHGLDQFDEVMRWRRGRRLVRHASRDVTQLDLDTAGRAVRVYVKREWATYLKDRLMGFLEGLGWGTKVRHEWHMLEAMGRAGIGCAEPIAVVERGGPRPRGYLIVREIPRAIDLKRYLAARCASMTVGDRRALAAHLGREVARLHAAGFEHPDLFSKHVILSDPDPVAQPPADPAARLPRVCFIDLQRSLCGRQVSQRQRIRNLAALDATLARELVAATDRLAFLAAYLESARLPLDRRQAIAAIRRRVAVLHRRRKIREMLGDTMRLSDYFVPLDDRSLFAAPDWVEPLRRLGLDQFSAAMNAQLGRLLRRLPDRDNVLLELAGQGGPVRAYLKRHRGWYPLPWLRERLLGRRSYQPGDYEAAQICRLARVGIPNMELIAFGHRFGSWGRGESFVITREVPDALPLDDLLRSQFTGPLEPAQRRRLRSLIRQIADVARRLHDAGYNHQDFYCCHFLVRPAPGRQPESPGEDAEFDVHLIDLQRVQYRRGWRGRWVVKDLAQLNYSAPREAISCADRVRFLKAYLGVERLGRAERWLIRRILFKTALIARHDARKQGRRAR